VILGVLDFRDLGKERRTQGFFFSHYMDPLVPVKVK